MAESIGKRISPKRLIKAVKKHKMLYDKDDPYYYHHQKQKSMGWQEVCEEVIPNWEDMRPHQKVQCCYELQKRWKSLRTCFGREVLEQKKEEQRRKKNLPIKRRKVYEYFHRLSFLLPSYNMSCRKLKSSDNDESTNDDHSDEDVDEDPLESVIKAESTDSVFDGTSKHEPMMLETDTFLQINDINQSSDGKIINYLKDVKKDEDDEDKQFLNSLLPTFRKLNDKQKFEARIDILKVLKKISFRHERGSIS